MKHFDELTNLETALIAIETHVALLDGFVQGMECVDQMTAANGLYGIASILKADSKQLYEVFDQLFSAVREETNAKKSGRKK